MHGCIHYNRIQYLATLAFTKYCTITYLFSIVTSPSTITIQGHNKPFLLLFAIELANTLTQSHFY